MKIDEKIRGLKVDIQYLIGFIKRENRWEEDVSKDIIENILQN